MGKLKPQPSASDDRTSLPFGDDAAEIRLHEAWVRSHNQVADGIKARLAHEPAEVGYYLQGFTEIAHFMICNTCGVGSNFKLADCEIQAITPACIQSYYHLLMLYLAYHLRVVNPGPGEAVWAAMMRLSGNEELNQAIFRELSECVDPESGQFSPVRAGRKLWERVATLLHIQHAEQNSMARIYYQTAPGQNLLFLAENAAGTRGEAG